MIAAGLQTSDITSVSSKKFIDIQATIECRFTMKRVRGMIRIYSQIRDLEVDGCHSNLYVKLKQLLLFYKFYDLFCRRHSLVNRLCHNNLSWFLQNNNFRNLHRVIFTHWKHIGFRVNAVWYCFSVIKRYTFHYIDSHSRKPELFQNISIVWYMALSKFSDITF